MSFPNMKFEPAKAIANPYTSAVISNGWLNERTTFLDKLEKRLHVIYGGSYKNNNSVGLTTLKYKHIEFQETNQKLIIDFIGKKGVRNVAECDNKIIYDYL